ncbi:MAG: hypothetical protein K2O39_06295, partial [Clostridiales bacterium]|nr:hypothetical protein [Clostridiales bacterium]
KATGAPRTPEGVTIDHLDGKTAVVTQIVNAIGAFDITVTATVGGETYTKTQKYYFMYGADIADTLYVSNDNGTTYKEFGNKTEQNIDYTTDPYKFKYEITGVHGDGVANIVVNGDVESTAVQITGNTRYWIITATKPTTMRIGASVNIGSRTVYLEEKTVVLTATAPDFTLTAKQGTVDKDTVLPSETLTMSVGNAQGFIGEYSVAYSVQSGSAYATITSGVLTAKTNVVTDQTVIVRATITVQNGVYAGRTYRIDKSVTITGVALPTIAWKANANKELCLKDKAEFTYSTESYTFANNGTYDYTDHVDIELSAENGTLTKGADFTFNATERKITLNTTTNTKAGGSLKLIVKATITSGAHAGETVSDTLTVRVLPTMNDTASNITLGNAKATYDLNGTAFKSTFAPNTNNGTGFVN